jgi:transcriptional regulator with XRE-family HTH domain
MYEKFVRDRITELRLSRNLSEYQMSYDLGKSRGYIYNISAGKALPPLKELFKIIEYFEITPAEFFDDRSRCPHLVHRAINGMSGLTEEDLDVVISVIGRLCVMRGVIEDLKAEHGESEPQNKATQDTIKSNN